MPSFNPKTRKMRYAKSDENLLEGCRLLLEAIQEFDDEAPSVDVALQDLQKLGVYIGRKRSPPEKSSEKPKLAS